MPTLSAIESDVAGIWAFREEFRAEARCQIVHDSLHDRGGWTKPYLLKVDDLIVGFGGILVGGNWKGRRTVCDFYLRPAHRAGFRAMREVFLSASGADSLKAQTNLPLVPELIVGCGGAPVDDAVVFGEGRPTALPANGAFLRRQTSERRTKAAIRERAGNCEWTLEIGGTQVGKGGLMFHYNVPYADVYMDIEEQFRRRGLGAFLVQEIRREAHNLGAIPAARSNPANFASHQTLRKAGFDVVGKIVEGAIPKRSV